MRLDVGQRAVLGSPHAKPNEGNRMQRLKGRRACAALFTLAALAVGAGPAQAHGVSQYDQVTAGGVTGANSIMGGASRSGPSGEDPHGAWLLLNDRGIKSIAGHTTCLNVYGNRATVAIQIDKASNPALVGMYRVMFVEDNGTPGAGVDYIYGLAPQALPSTCNEPFTKNVPIRFGDIVVNDVTP